MDHSSVRSSSPHGTGGALAHALSGTAPGAAAAVGKNAAIQFGGTQQQQVHGAGETVGDSSSRDSMRSSSSMDSTASPEHKADAELMVSFLTEMHMKQPPQATTDETGCHAPPAKGESLLLSLKAREGARAASWGEQPTTLATVLSSSSSTVSAGTKPGDACARIEDEEEDMAGARDRAEQEEEDSEDDEDANLVVTFRRTASTSSVSDASDGEDSDLSEDEGTRLPPSHRPTQSSGSWSLFNSLVTEAGNGSRKLERQRQRNLDCPWQRIGYYRRCDGKYGEDPSLYDSEDSDYEEPDDGELAPASASSFASSQTMRGGHGPFPSNYGYVRDMMVKMDTAADRPVPGGVPKYFRDWGKPKRRDALRQQKIKRDREERNGGAGAYGGSSSSSGSSQHYHLQQQQQQHLAPAPLPSHFYPGSHPNSPSTTGSGFNSNLGNLAGAAGRHGPLTPQRSPPKKGSGSGAKVKGGSSGSLKKFKIPGQPAPKRQSTALNLSFEVQSNGLIRCKRCGKPDFKNHFALRSHLSHCPGTIHMKEQRMKIEAGLLPPETPLCLPVDEEEREEGAANAAWVPAFNGSQSGSNLGSRSGSFSGDSHHYASACSLPKSSSCKKLGASSSSSSSMGHSNSSFPSTHNYAMAPLAEPAAAAPAAVQPVFDGKPLVPEVVESGESLIGRTLSYRDGPAADGWEDVLVRNYRSRRNSHLIVYGDQTVEWVTLTDRNAHLEAGYRGSSSSSSSSVSDTESNASSANRRTYRLGDTSAPSAAVIHPLSSGATTLDSGSASSRNAFFGEQEALLTPKRPGGKRKTVEEEDEKEEMEVAAGHHAHHPQLPPKVQRVDHGNFYPRHAPTTHTQTGGPSLHNIPHISRHTPVSNFLCRRCNKNFHNKQALGWHTRKGCNGHPGTAVTNHAHPPSYPGAAYPPPPHHMHPYYAHHPHYAHALPPPPPPPNGSAYPGSREVQPMPPAYAYPPHY